MSSSDEHKARMRWAQVQILYEKVLQKSPNRLEARAWAKKKVDELVRKAIEEAK